MTPQPFTPQGVQALQAELNQLSQQDLQTQANLISSDLRSWVNDNFTLDSDQQTFLANIDDNFIAYAAAVTSYAVINKLPVSLTVDGGKPTPLKLIHAGDNMYCTWSSNGFSVTGGVTYSVEYQ